LAEAMHHYETAFAKVLAMTKCSNINELVKRFTQVEDQNFSLFNFVNEVNNQIETFVEEIAQLERQMAGYNRDVASEEESRRKDVQALDEKLKTAQHAVEVYTQQFETANRLMDSVAQGIDRIVSSLALPPSEAAGASVPHEQRLMENMSKIEEKTGALLMKNLLLSLPKRFTSAAVPNSASERKEGEADDKAAQQESKDPAALAAMLQSLMVTSGFTYSALLGQGPTAPITRFAINAPSTGYV
jgi:phage-related tail protein